jgi:hypothetical protein
MSLERTPEIKPDWNELLEAALDIPGNVGNTYRRLYDYSMGNLAFLLAQGVTPQPVASYDRWKQVDRHVKRGAKARYILRPITVKLKDELDDEGNPKSLQTFKAVKSVFPLEDTEGEPLPPPLELPIWSQERCLGNMAIKLVEFANFYGNAQGYSAVGEIAINPIAVRPEATLFHELGHHACKHLERSIEEYGMHRGVFEFEAEGTAHLVMKELDRLTPEVANKQRGYMQSWTKGAVKPSNASVRTIFKATDKILRSGRESSIIDTDTYEYQKFAR